MLVPRSFIFVNIALFDPHFHLFVLFIIIINYTITLFL
jgi:hypothetical protein